MAPSPRFLAVDAIVYNIYQNRLQDCDSARADPRPWASRELANAEVVLDVAAERFVDRWMEVVCRSAPASSRFG
jgi:hypothetical protein